MKRLLAFPLLGLLIGCGGGTSYVHSETTLGRVVVYRNGVAYFERTAQLDSDSLKLAVPADKVDDFLKSLTVVDAKTGKPAPVSYPTSAPSAEGTGLIDMKISLPGPQPHQVRLSYVTEAPSWKPSYRVVLGDPGKVDFQAWAIVDNTSGEDWKNVKLGVGSSSAMSFRFDLRSLRLVERETLQSNDLFAIAPPTGASVYGGEAPREAGKKITVLSDDAIAAAEPKPDAGSAAAPPAQTASAPTATKAPAHVGHGRALRAEPTKEIAPATERADAFEATAQRLNASGNKGQIVIEGYAGGNDADKNAAALERANKVRWQLTRRGVDPNRMVAISRGAAPGGNGSVRILEGEEARAATAKGADTSKSEKSATNALPADPIGTSHFESGSVMSVARGTSAMVSILSTRTDGEVVYLYDPESPRGNGSFAFKSVRLKNPTDSALESGPVSVFGEGRFIGEGLTEPIPPHTTAFVPFALDRQIVVEPKNEDRDEITRVITVQRGIFSAEMQHTRRSTWTLHNRLGERATVYVRHTPEQGYKLSPASAPPVERIGAATLFRVTLEPGQKKDVMIEEQTPQFRTVDVRSDGGMEMVRVFLAGAAMSGPLKGEVTELLKLQQDIGNTEQRISTLRDQMQEYRERMDELHAQIVTLRAVKTAGPLMHDLEKKLGEVSDKLSKATIDVVALQEKLMVARIHFQDGVADLSLDKKEAKSGS